jgi:hypothetical protein
MLRRGGVTAAATVAGLTLLDQRRAEAANGSNFVLGTSNNADATTTLTPTTSGVLANPMFKLDGSNLSGTSTTAEVDGPNAGQSTALRVSNGGGGLALQVNAASTATTTGLAIQANGSGPTLGVVGNSGSGAGVTGTSGTGTGVSGSSGKSGPGVHGSSKTGPGVQGSGAIGGDFSGSAAAVWLRPSTKSTHPAAGRAGELFVDHLGHLWYCKHSGSHASWVKLA